MWGLDQKSAHINTDACLKIILVRCEVIMYFKSGVLWLFVCRPVGKGSIFYRNSSKEEFYCSNARGDLAWQGPRVFFFFLPVL